MNKLAKSTIFLVVVMFLAKIISFGKDLCLSYQYGASNISDAYLVAVNIPTVLFSGIVTAVFTCYIPVYNEIKGKKPEYVNKFNSNIVNVIAVLSVFLVILYWIFPEQIINLFVSGFNEENFQLAVSMSKIMVLAMIFMAVSCVLQGYLQANGCFYLVGMMTIPTNLIMAFTIMLSDAEHLEIMIWGTVLAYAIYLPYFFIPAYKKGFRYVPYIKLKDEYLKKLLTMIIPIFIGQMILEINVIVDKNFASGLEAGSITGLDYAYKVAMLIQATAAASISTVIYPKFSEQVVSQKITELKKTLSVSLNIVIICVIPLVIGMCVLAYPIIQLLFFRGAFSERALQITAESLICYSIGMLPIALRTIMEKVFYAYQETKIPMLNSAIGILSNIILDILLVPNIKHCGLALATSISSFITYIIFYIKLRKKIGGFGAKRMFVTVGKVGIAGGIMGIIVWMMKEALFVVMGNGTLQLMGSIISLTLVGMVIYIVLLFIFRQQEALILKNYIIKRMKKKH